MVLDCDSVYSRRLNSTVKNIITEITWDTKRYSTVQLTL